MVSITRDPNTQNSPDYLNLSRGTDKARAIADTSMGDLFKNVAAIGDSAVKFAYKDIDQSIQKGLEDKINGVRSDFGVDDATKIAASGVSPTEARGAASDFAFDPMAAGRSSKGAPPGVAKVGNAISDLQTAYDQGKLSESYYNARLMAIVKEAKANNPGFSEEVDRHVQSITGINPANALRRSLLSDLDMAERARTAALSKDETFGNSHLGDMSPDVRMRWTQGERSPSFLAEMKNDVGNTLAYSTYLTQKKNSLELDLEQNKYDQTKATQIAGLSVNAIVNKSFADATSGAGGLGSIQKLITQHGDKPWSPEEDATLRNQLGAAKTQLTLQLQAELASPAYSKMDAEQKAKILKDATDRIDTMSKAVLDKDTGVLTRNANYVQAVKDADTRSVLDKSGWLRLNTAISGLPGGKEFINTMNMNDTGPNSYFGRGVKAVKDLEGLEMGTGANTSLDKQLERRGELAGSHPEANSAAAHKDLIDSAARSFSKADNDQIALNAGKVLFGTGNASFLRHYDAASRGRMFASLFTGDASKRAIELGKTNPEFLKSYSAAAMDGFNVVFRSRLQDITGEARSANSPLSIQWDANSGQFVPSILPGQKESVLGPGAKNYYDQFAQTIRDVNLSLKAIEPIVKANGGDMNQALIDVLHANGWKDGAKDPTLVQRLGDIVKSAFTSKEQAPGAKASDFPEQKSGKQSYNFDSFPEGKAVRSDYASVPAGQVVSLDDKGLGDIAASGKGLKNVIRAAESGDNYDNVFGTSQKIPITKMTVNDVLGLQDEMRRKGSPSTAVGGYQFLQGTLKGLVKEMKLSGKETFDQALQDRLADRLLQRRGYGDFLSGKLGKKEFVNRLSQEWAGLPTTEGRSFYEGDGLNHSTVKLRNVLAELQSGETQPE